VLSPFLEFHRQVGQLLESKQSFVIITLTQIEGHVPQAAGAKAIVTKSGLHWGTVGGGRLEAAAIEEATKALANTHSSSWSRPYDLQRELNMVCGGRATLFFEYFASDPFNIIVFGAGHVAQALAPILLTLCDHLTIVDPRPEWIARLPKHERLKTICCDNPKDIISENLASHYIVCVTQGHWTDLPVVEEILKCFDPPYLGVIGSQPKSRTLKASLADSGVDSSRIAKIHCPIGLPIGGSRPEEIAISIAAQIIQVHARIKCRGPLTCS
jgi:xanthine dehydrogenase accessory factor